jgi:hypothetical protein
MAETLEIESPSESAAGSSETESEVSLQCPYCPFVGKTERGLAVHVSHKHKDQSEPAFEDKPTRQAPTGPPLERKAPPLPVDLKALETETAQNIAGVGQLLHGVLLMGKIAKIQNPDGRLPEIDTHLGFALQLRADMTARLLTEYAAKNQTVMRVLQGFNALFKGGEAAQLVGSLALAGLASAGQPVPGPFQGMLNRDVVQAVDAENRELYAQMQAAQRAAAATNGHPA